MTRRALRFGILGAARIAAPALITPCASEPRAVVVGVASRSRERATAFARQHSISWTAPNYGALVRHPDVDAVYNALPASSHFEWTVEALRAGKHVLCEKPFAANADQAERMVAEAERAGRVVAEAFHYRYHPLAHRFISVCQSGMLGRVEELDAGFNVPVPNRGDIRWQASLAGGATMDLGCYPIHWLRAICQSEPEVRWAEAEERTPGVDACMQADLRFPDGARGRVHCSMKADTTREAWLHVRGSAGEMRVTNPLAPHLGNELRVRTRDGESAQAVEGDTTYTYQLGAFTDVVLDGGELPTGGKDAIGNMRTIDAVYRAAGMSPR
ncbi:MAG: Gfo/Idh/MocA family oxidoreductase [Proteobacteria bacterium]|nr:Gfo/Idh/MocA family oxidoreductase [Pseudomonadota bacterium]